MLLKTYVTPLITEAIAGGLGKAVEQFVLILYITAGAPVLIKLLGIVQNESSN